MSDPILDFVEAGRVVPLAEGRALIQRAMIQYLSEPDPNYMLLIQADPAVGKSHAAIQVAEQYVRAAHKGRRKARVLFAEPRHAMFDSVIRMANQTEDWYHWQQRKLDPTGLDETCRWTGQMKTWLNRGYQSNNFCWQACGPDYMNNTCPYRLQRLQREPIIFGMHQHVFLSHPLAETFSAVIGDENPFEAALRRWEIPAQYIVPAEADPFDDSAGMRLLKRIQAIALSGGHFEGRDLLEALALTVEGAAGLLNGITLQDGMKLASPHLPPRRNTTAPPDPSGMPFFCLPELVKLLRREVEWALMGKDYVTRVIVHGGVLYLLLRHSVNPKLPKKMIWLDALGDPALYEEVFQRNVKTVTVHVERVGDLYQVCNRANGKGALLVDDEEQPGKQKASRKATQARHLIDHLVATRGYKRVGVYTFKGLIESDLAAAYPTFQFGNFGAETGTNDFDALDALFVLGAPLPKPEEIVEQAKMLFFNRMDPFDTTWSQQAVLYDECWEIENEKVGNFWNDRHLKLIVPLLREAKIVQAAHRSRVNIRPVDVWLVTNIPIKGAWLTRQPYTAQEIFEAPDGVNPYQWGAFVETGKRLCLENEARYGERNVIRREMIQTAQSGGTPERSVDRYWKIAQGIFEESPITALDFTRHPGGGRPPKPLDFTTLKQRGLFRQNS